MTQGNGWKCKNERFDPLPRLEIRPVSKSGAAVVVEAIERTLPVWWGGGSAKLAEKNKGKSTNQ